MDFEKSKSNIIKLIYQFFFLINLNIKKKKYNVKNKFGMMFFEKLIEKAYNFDVNFYRFFLFNWKKI